MCLAVLVHYLSATDGQADVLRQHIHKTSKKIIIVCRRFKPADGVARVSFENDRPNGHADVTTTDENQSTTDTASTTPTS